MKNVWKLLLVLAALCLAAGIWNAYVISYKNPAVTRYEVDCGLDEPVWIVQLSDLHDAEFGEGKAELIVKPEQALRVMKVIDAIFESNKTGRGIVCSI